MATPGKTILAFTHGREHPSTRFRILQYAGIFEKAKWQTRVHVFWPPAIPLSDTSGALIRLWARLIKLVRTARVIVTLCMHRSCDVVLVSREVPSALFPFLKRAKNLIIDFDDAIYLGSEEKNVAKLCRGANAIVAGNKILAATARNWNPRTIVIPTVVDAGLYRIKKDYMTGSVVKIGWIGSIHSIDYSLWPILPLIADLQKTLALELIVICRPRPVITEPGLSWRFIEWSPATENALADLIDIGIMPLQDTEYQRAKCGAKLLQYMAAAIPAVASPWGANADIIQHNRTGLHANNPEEWKTTLASLAGDMDLRARLGTAGREHVLNNFSVGRWGPVWKNLLEEVAAT